MGNIAGFSNGSTRAYAGAIVTLVDVDSGDVRTIHRGGYSHEVRRWGDRKNVTLSFRDVMKRLVEEVRRWEGDWKIRCISTPTSILLDLRGRANSFGDSSIGVATYEASVLSSIGCIDMWEGSYAKDSKERARRAAEHHA